MRQVDASAFGSFWRPHFADMGYGACFAIKAGSALEVTRPRLRHPYQARLRHPYQAGARKAAGSCAAPHGYAELSSPYQDVPVL